MPKLNRRARAAARALHFSSVADRAASDARSPLYACGCDREDGQCREDCPPALAADARADRDLAEAADYDRWAAEAARAAGDVGAALDSVRGAREAFAREYASWYAGGAEEAPRAAWALQVPGADVQIALRRALGAA